MKTFADEVEKPKFRSPLRMFLGRLLFSYLRYMKWHFENDNYSATLIPEQMFSNLVYQDKSVLLRQLKDVDMYLQRNKIKNLCLAIPHLDGLIILPGQTMSYWKCIGKPSKNRGFVEGMVLHNGKISIETGGGLCQLSNLIFWTALHTPLKITERWRHNYDVFPDASRDRPFGSGATCSYNYVDLQIKNTTNIPFQLSLWLDDEYLNAAWRSAENLNATYEVIEKEHRIIPQVWGGYTRHNKLFRKTIFLDTNEYSEELICENHGIMMYSPLLESGKQGQ